MHEEKKERKTCLIPPIFFALLFHLSYCLAVGAGFLDFKKNTVVSCFTLASFLFPFFISISPSPPAFGTFILVHHSFRFTVLFYFFPF